MLSGGVQTVLGRLRRGVADGQALRGFTVARTEALLRLRDVPRAPWAWTLGLLRAARLLSTSGRAVVQAVEEGDERVVTLGFGVGGSDLSGAELRAILHASVASEEDGAEPEATWLGALGQRWRAEVGAAINAGLASGPRSIELRTSAAARAYVRRDSLIAGQDPYGEQAGTQRCPVQAFEVVIREARAGAGRRLTAWLARQSGAAAQVEALWREALFLAPAQAGMVELGRPLPGYRVKLGEHAVWGAAPEIGGPWLVRTGVRTLSLGAALGAVGLEVEAMRGWIECPSLRVTADEAGVVQDAAFELLVAWLHDAREHSYTLPAGTSPTGQVGRDSEGAAWVVVWPTQVESVVMASGRALEREAVAQRARGGRDFLYAWKHQQRQVPPAMQARTHTLWPSELAVLQAGVPELRPVPVRALGDSPQVERVDLTGLTQSSLPAVEIDLGAEGVATTQGGARVELALRAFVHRGSTATQGATALLAYGRRVAQVRESARVLPGVTLVCELSGASIDGLRGETALLQALADRCRVAGERVMPMLVAQGMAHASPWEVPLVRAQAEALTGAAISLRYRSERGESGPELAWDESPLLGLQVGRDEPATRPVTLLQALERCRDVGGIVVEVLTQAWPGWVSRAPEHAPWALTAEGRGLLERVIGKDVLWDMPTLPEMHALPRPVSQQTGLVLAPEELARLTEKTTEDKARAAVLAHMLVQRAHGDGAGGLDELPLLRRFDPRALQPVRRVSLAQALAEAPRPGLLAAGAVSRGLAGPVVLVTPGEAWLLHGEGFAPASTTSAGTATTNAPGHARPVRRAGGAGLSLLVVPVATAAAVGVLRLDGTAPAKVALWSGGLHLDDLQLPAPLDCVGGRLVLTRQGARVVGERLAGEIQGLCRIMVAQAIDQQRLHRPHGPQHLGLGEFLARCQAAVEAGGGALIADLLSRKTDQDVARLGQRLSASLQRHPLERLPQPGPRRFESLLRQALARPLAVGSAVLSWQVASLETAAGAATGWNITLGRRNEFVQRAVMEAPGPEDAEVATALAISGLFGAARKTHGRDSGVADEWVADYRLLALVYAHAP